MARSSVPRWVFVMGWLASVPAVIAAGYVLWVDTLQAMRDGPRAGGFDLLTGTVGHVIPYGSLAIGFAWLLVVAIFAVMTKSFGGPKGLAPLAVLVAAWGGVILPQGLWVRLIAGEAAKGPHAAEFLASAAARGDIATVSSLLDHGVPVDAVEFIAGRTALYFAASAGRTEVVELLISKGARVNAITSYGDSPLHTALIHKQGDTAKVLESHGGEDIRFRFAEWKDDGMGPQELRARSNALVETREAFRTEQFDKLEEIASRLTAQSPTGSGISLMREYYGGISTQSYLTGCSQEPWLESETKTQRWLDRYPQSPHALIAHAIALLGHGWYIRGCGYADKVSSEAWEGFLHYAKLAREHLEQSKPIASADPQWYAEMFEVAQAQGWEQRDFEKLYDKATTAFPEEGVIYYFAMYYLLPKWHGSWQAFDEFADDAAARSAKGTGKALYTRIYWNLWSYRQVDDLFRATGISWGKMKVGFDDIVAKYPDPWNVNNYAKFACMAGDKEKTRELLTKIGDKPIPRAWEAARYYRRCKAWADL
jgi:hypothetical protein